MIEKCPVCGYDLLDEDHSVSDMIYDHLHSQDECQETLARNLGIDHQNIFDDWEIIHEILEIILL